jgi:hypothetical protein
VAGVTTDDVTSAGWAAGVDPVAPAVPLEASALTAAGEPSAARTRTYPLAGLVAVTVAPGAAAGASRVVGCPSVVVTGPVESVRVTGAGPVAGTTATTGAVAAGASSAAAAAGELTGAATGAGAAGAASAGLAATAAGAETGAVTPVGGGVPPGWLAV